MVEFNPFDHLEALRLKASRGLEVKRFGDDELYVLAATSVVRGTANIERLSLDDGEPIRLVVPAEEVYTAYPDDDSYETHKWDEWLT